MHHYRTVISKGKAPQGSSSAAGSGPPRPPSREGNREDDDARDHDSLLPEPQGDAEDGFSYHGRSSRGAPLATRAPKAERPVEVVFDGDEELENTAQASADAPEGATELVPYAHRDIKPA